VPLVHISLCKKLISTKLRYLFVNMYIGLTCFLSVSRFSLFRSGAGVKGARDVFGRERIDEYGKVVGIV